jgi:hypothetical protein
VNSSANGGGLDGDDALAVDPDALEELGQQLAARIWVGFGLPEGGEVL